MILKNSEAEILTQFLQELEQLVCLESPTEDLERNKEIIKLAKNIVDRNLSGGCEIREVKSRPILLWGEQNFDILLLTHLDTVWPVGTFNPTWNIAGDEISGPGIFDMKAGFLQAIYALSNLQKQNIDIKRFALLATTDEETGSFSSVDLIKELSAKSKAVLVFESALDTGVKVARKGTAMYQVKVVGKAAHAGLEPEKGINSIVEAANLVLKIASLNNPDKNTSVVPTIIKGGTTTNTVPEITVIEVDARSFDENELELVDKQITSLKPDNSNIKVEISGGINRPPLPKSKSDELFKILQIAGKKASLPEISAYEVGGASDGNFAAMVCPLVLDGLGAVGAGAHAKNEHIKKSEIIPRINLLTSFFQELVNE